MTDLQSSISYLRGLADGMDLSENSKEGKIIMGILKVLEDMSDSILDIEDSQDDLEHYIETIDEDLNDLEVDYYGDEDCDCGCECDDDYLEVECPICHDSVCIDSNILDDDSKISDLSCPNCDESIFDAEE
ncbi:hypothetical protein SAMN00017405_0274 [Desulfonispora thiosulfatigenes DSM 11270]|uniref:Uncharacterized protein n=1 Tax=Desulfonispora thiosulfatigenes DSM 11270 TaxID=656914 RepID=A0A1W1VNI1_DESTI|nr:CD1247 N-terminal domain-containing protein [Desulfonispora thiosulfatigenes]SMB94790.1 hypothetical protein SAMN00017405_0274 [Desulfonispora thiosulfatigenes DSM 11270]